MAYTTIDDPSAYFKVQLYSGNGTAIASGGNVITFNDTDTDMQPDFVWYKERSSTSGHHLHDAARGTTKKLSSDSNAADNTNTETLTSFNSDGFTVGSAGGSNESGQTYVAWCWKGGTTSGITGTADITPSAYSFNTTSGFSVCVYSGVGNAGDTLKTGLSSGIDFYFLKRLDSSSSWSVLGSASPLGAGKYLYLDINDGVATNDAFDDDVAPSAAGVVTLGDNGNVNASGGTHIFYGWKSIQGFSKFGSYTGNGNADGPMLHMGFSPAWIMCKKTSATGDSRTILDNKRDPYNVADARLFADQTAVERKSTDVGEFLSNGFKIRTTAGTWNDSGGTYIYLAFAESPFVNSNGIPNNAR